MPNTGSNACEILRVAATARSANPVFGYRQGSVEAGGTAEAEPTDVRAPLRGHADAVWTALTSHGYDYDVFGDRQLVH
jgi:hypothetical protein